MSTEKNITSTRSSSGFKLKLMQPKEFSGCSIDGEDVGNEALSWLKKVERIKCSGKFSDEEILFFIGDYLVKKAEIWFNVVGSKATTWSGFVKLFKKQYLVDQEDKWWSELQSMKQSKHDSIDDIALKMEELFNLLDNKNEAYQVRTFLSAIDKTIAFQVERDGTPATFLEAKNKAKQIDKSLKKYLTGAKLTEENTTLITGSHLKQDSYYDEVYEARNSSLNSDDKSDVSSLVAKLEQLSINLVKLSENVQRTVNTPIQKAYENKNFSRSFTCFHCGLEGHKKWDCPTFLQEEKNNKTMVTGSNAIPVNNSRMNEDSGKGKEHQL